MILADDFSIIGFILSFPYFLDIIIVLFLLVGASIGYARGFWRGTFNLIVSIILLLISWSVLLEPLAIFVHTRLFTQLGITFKVGSSEATSVEELIRLMVDAHLEELPEKFANPQYVTGLSYSLSKAIAWFLVVLAVNLLSWILSGILYFLIMRLIIPDKLRKIKLRLLGAIMGLLQTVIVVFSYMIFFSNISPAMSKIVECGSEDFTWCNDNIRMVLEALNPYNSMLSPYVTNLQITLENKFEFVVDEVKYNLDDELQEFFDLISNLNINEEELALL